MISSISVFSQKKVNQKQTKAPTTKETILWIESVIKTYGKGNIEFKNEKIYYNIPNYSITNGPYNQEAFLKDLYGVNLSESYPNVIRLSCTKKDCVYVVVDSGRLDFNGKNIIILLNEGMPNDVYQRLTKAFNHLAKLYNTNQISNTF
jgi:disulfide oxidoreductase YuzD